MKNLIVISLVLLWLTSCHTLKTVSHEVRDSVVVRTIDSVVYHSVTNTKDSIVTHDSAIGISGASASFDLAYNSTTDTVVKKGTLRITRYVNKGVEHIDCTSDSLTIVVMDLQTVIRQKTSETDNLRLQLSSTAKTHTDIEVKAQADGLPARLWARVRNGFAWFGLLAAIALILWVLKKFVIP